MWTMHKHPGAKAATTSCSTYNDNSGSAFDARSPCTPTARVSTSPSSTATSGGTSGGTSGTTSSAPIAETACRRGCQSIPIPWPSNDVRQKAYSAHRKRMRTSATSTSWCPSATTTTSISAAATARSAKGHFHWITDSLTISSNNSTKVSMASAKYWSDVLAKRMGLCQVGNFPVFFDHEFWSCTLRNLTLQPKSVRLVSVDAKTSGPPVLVRCPELRRVVSGRNNSSPDSLT